MRRCCKFKDVHITPHLRYNTNDSSGNFEGIVCSLPEGHEPAMSLYMLPCTSLFDCELQQQVSEVNGSDYMLNAKALLTPITSKDYLFVTN